MARIRRAHRLESPRGGRAGREACPTFMARIRRARFIERQIIGIREQKVRKCQFRV